MKKSEVKLVYFNIAFIVIFFLSNFILGILNYFSMAGFLIAGLVFFKFLFGFEKDNHRYSRDILLNILIVLLTSFLIYYIIGILIGFIRANTQYSIYGLTHFVIPYIIVVILEELLRYQLIIKSGKKLFLVILSCVTFIIFDIMININLSTFSSNMQIFMFLALYLFPAISKNIVATYISYNVGYKPNIVWILVTTLYASLIPIIPDVGQYIGSMIHFLFPLVIGYSAYDFFRKRKNKKPLSYEKNHSNYWLVMSTLFVIVIIYFTSGFFRYYTIAIATGSMVPNINKGDVVIIDQRFKEKDLKVGQVIAYQLENRIIVHRLKKIVTNGEETVYYTKGDANNTVDNYAIYSDMLMGTVDTKIPYIGLPTVWLNEL